MSKNIASQCKHRARIGCMRHELRGVIWLEFAPQNFARSVHGCIHKDDFGSAGNLISELRCQQRADERTHAGQAKVANRLGHAWANAIVTAQRVAVADNQDLRFD